MIADLNYSALDRLLHRVAFAAPSVQLTTADIEAVLYRDRLRSIDVERPIFVTSLPRAGTTLMLEALSRIPGLATHSYRDMPFVLAPLLWETLSRPFRRTADLKDRAHGDGMLIGYDSPEAFEEILWRTFWPNKFLSDRIELWSDAEDEADDFLSFFVEHMRKVIAVRQSDRSQPTRYLSKNNANIARLGLLNRLFPDSVILIPFRNPVDQAASLLRQHLRFLERHRTDAFARRYMQDIGHMEFGELHRPIGFAGVRELIGNHQPDRLDYWVAYWISAFRHAVRFRSRVLFASYERFCEHGASGLRTIAGSLGLQPNALEGSARVALRTPRHAVEDTSGLNHNLLEQAQALHAELLGLSVV